MIDLFIISGYVADVSYVGEAKYPEYKPAASSYKPVYKPAPAPAYKPAPAPPAYKPAPPPPAYKPAPRLVEEISYKEGEDVF